MSMSLMETNLRKDALHGHREVTGDDVFYIRSDNNPGLVKEKCMENKYSAGSLDDIGKVGVSLEERIKTKASKETFSDIPRESVVEIPQRGKKEVTPPIVPRETIHSAKGKEEFSRSGMFSYDVYSPD